MSKRYLFLSLALLTSCTTKESRPDRPTPTSNNQAPGIPGPAGKAGATGNDGSKGEKGEQGDVGASLGSKLERIAKINDCGDKSGVRITVWTETQVRDGLMQKEEEPTAHSSYLCDGAQGETGSTGKDGAQGADGRNGADGKNLAVLTETIHSWDSACYDKGGYRLKIWLDADADRIIDASEEASLSTQIICNGAKGDRGPSGSSGPSGSDGRAGRDAYTYTIKNISLTSNDQEAIHNGRQTLVCAADVLTAQPDFYPQNRLVAKIFSNGREILKVAGATLENDRYLLRFPVNAGWTAAGSTVSCEITLHTGYRDSGIIAKEMGPAATVVASSRIVPARMQDVLQTRAEDFSGKLSFVFTITADAPVAHNRCEFTLHKTLDGTVEKSSFILKKGETRVTLKANIPQAIDLRLDRFTVACEGDVASEMRLLWTHGLFEINPAATPNRNNLSYRLQLALLAVPFEFKDIGTYLPEAIRDRLTREYLPKVSLMTRSQRSGFILFLVSSGQFEILKNLTSLKTWYTEAVWDSSCSQLTDLSVLSTLFGRDAGSILSHGNSQLCSTVQQKASAASFASWKHDIEYSSAEAIPDYLSHLKYFKIANLKNFVKLFKHVLAKRENWGRDQQIADLLAVFQMQPELLAPANAAIFSELIPLLDNESAVTDSILAAWPELRTRFEDRLLDKKTPTMDGSPYQTWLSRRASAIELQAAVDKLGKTAGFVHGLTALLPKAKQNICPVMADAIKEKLFLEDDYKLLQMIETAMPDCRDLLVPTLAEGLGARLLALKSMPQYVEALLKLKGESADELASLNARFNTSSLETLELLRQGKITSALALKSLERRGFKLSDFAWLQTRPLYKSVWTSLAQESLQLALEILNNAEEASWSKQQEISLYLQLIPADQFASLQNLLVKASTRGYLVETARFWLLQTDISLTRESIETLSRTLQDSSMSLTLKLQHVPLFKKAGLNLDALIEALLEKFASSHDLEGFAGLGSIGPIQSSVVAAFGKGKLTDWQVQRYFQAEGCSPDVSDALHDLIPSKPSARGVLVACLLQKESLTSEEQEFVGSNLSDALDRQLIAGKKHHAYLVPYLGEFLRFHDSTDALGILVRLSPFSTEVKGILTELLTIHRASAMRTSVEEALKTL
jgi:hypothetical protein